MNGREDEVILVTPRHTGFVAGRGGRVEGELGEKTLARRIRGGDLVPRSETNTRRNRVQSSAAAGATSKACITATGSAAAPIASSRRVAVAGPIPGSRRAMRNPAMRLRGFSAQRSTHKTSFTCAASRNFSPPYLTKGI